MRIHNISSSIDKRTGGIPYGNYYVNNLLKIGVVTRKGKRITLQLLPSYKTGDTITLKKQRDIISYKVIYYGEFDNETNISLIEQSYRSMDKAQILNFWAVHTKELTQIFGENKFEEYLLATCIKIGRLPYQFEIVYKGNIITDINMAKQLWEETQNKKDFELLAYK